MSVIRRSIAGLTVLMKPTERPSAVHPGADTYAVTVEGVLVVVLTHSDHEGHRHWYCDRCHVEKHVNQKDPVRSSQKDSMLTHVVKTHAKQPPLLTADRGRTFEAMNTYMAIVGQHADPTYEQAMHDLYGSIW